LGWLYSVHQSAWHTPTRFPFRLSAQPTRKTGTAPGPVLRVSGGTTPATLQGFEFAESGASAQGSFGNDTGATATGDSYRYRTTPTAADIAFGQLNTPGLGPDIVANDPNPGTSFGLVFRNDTNSTIDSLTISYRGEQYRYGGAAGGPDRIDFQINNGGNTILGAGFTDVDNLDFSSVVQSGTIGALDGNLSANSSLINGLYAPTGGITAGSTFVIRFTPFDRKDGGTQVSDDGLAVDDFNLTANTSAVATPEPSTFALFGIGMLGFGVVVRRRKSADKAAASAGQGIAGLPC
jgi:hypothetical protein